jgi:arylsulfatase A-like enzyme
MNLGKSCVYETDINVPLVIRGLGVEKGAVKDFPTTHTYLAPTFFSLAGLDLRDDFDGVPIPVSESDDKNATKLEHVGVEFWGDQHFEGQFGGSSARNNTYKSLRVIGDTYNLAYTV